MSPDQAPAQLTVRVKLLLPRAKQERGKGGHRGERIPSTCSSVAVNSKDAKGPQVSLLYCPMFPHLSTHFSLLPCTFHCCRILRVELLTTVNWPRSILHQFTLRLQQNTLLLWGLPAFTAFNASQGTCHLPP